jgi:hypothetical protein
MGNGENMTKLMICNKCGWAHFPRTEAEVLEEARSFKRYFDSLSPDQQFSDYRRHEYSVETAIARDKQCFRCGNPNTDFHEETEADKIPAGVTIQGIIVPESDV